MKHKRTFLLFSFFSLIVLLGCKKECNDFNFSIFDWVPYMQSDSIVMVNDNVKDTLVVNTGLINHIDNIKSKSDCQCWDSYSVYFVSNSIDISVFFEKVVEIENAEIEINHEILKYSEKLEKFALNNKEYSNVIVFKNSNTTSSTYFKEIVISQFIGIISIESINAKWILINDSKRQIDISKLKLNKIYCE